jgi:hypothetical protein
VSFDGRRRRAVWNCESIKLHRRPAGGSHVTIFEAEVELVPGDVRVEVATTYPRDADPADVKAAVEAIRQGAERVLQPRGQGVIIHVARLVVHLVDFKASKFERYTAEELTRVLEAAAEQGAAADGGS